jgi:hypothetical protein
VGGGHNWTELRPEAGVTAITVTCAATGAKYVGDGVYSDFSVRGRQRGLYIAASFGTRA